MSNDTHFDHCVDEVVVAILSRAGITEGLVRISLGTENWRELLADFERALEG